MLIELSMRKESEIMETIMPKYERKYEWSNKTASLEDVVEIVSGEERLKAMKRFRGVVP